MQPATEGGVRRAMPLRPALEVLVRLRKQQVVVTTMGAAREWPRLSDHPLDFHYLPSSMGQAPLIGLGLAMARPEREVIVLNGDGCMLMNLGALATIAACGAANYTLVVLENGVFEVTGGQRTAAPAELDFAALARAAGIRSAAAFDDLSTWQAHAADVLALPGPRFIVLRVQTVSDYQLPAPPPMQQRLKRFCRALEEAPVA
jgi:sulfopyruvate decarboxylase subunit beta